MRGGEERGKKSRKGWGRDRTEGNLLWKVEKGGGGWKDIGK